MSPYVCTVWIWSCEMQVCVFALVKCKTTLDILTEIVAEKLIDCTKHIEVVKETHQYVCLSILNLILLPNKNKRLKISIELIV